MKFYALKKVSFAILFLFTIPVYAFYAPPDSSGENFAYKKIKWQYNTPWEWKVEIPQEYVAHYRRKARPKWTGYLAYYAKYIEPTDKGILILVEGLKETIEENAMRYAWSYEEQLMFVVSMVQQMPYIPDDEADGDSYEKYPLETLFDGGGDCEDKAILCAALLERMGYDVSLIFVETPNKKKSHIAIGAVLREPTDGHYFRKGTKNYYYIETTTAGWEIGEIPDEWEGLPGVIIDVN
ncbi:MAG: hypothetical protein ACKVTZ_16400 [Bacteroidia bacterium]